MSPQSSHDKEAAILTRPCYRSQQWLLKEIGLAFLWPQELDRDRHLRGASDLGQQDENLACVAKRAMRTLEIARRTLVRGGSKGAVCRRSIVIWSGCE